MTLWQYNAWTEAYREREIDELAIQIQGAFMGAYWNSAAHHKKSLNSVLENIRAPLRKNKKVVKAPIDLTKVEEQFAAYEELKNSGWTGHV